MKGQDGVHGLIRAIYFNRQGCLKALIDAGANVNGKGIHTPETPLLVAVRDGNYECTDILLEAGADVNLPNFVNITPLICAAYGDWYRLVDKLIDAGADVNGVDDLGRTALMVATKLQMSRPLMGDLEFSRIKCVKLLLQVYIRWLNR